MSGISFAAVWTVALRAVGARVKIKSWAVGSKVTSKEDGCECVCTLLFPDPCVTAVPSCQDAQATGLQAHACIFHWTQTETFYLQTITCHQPFPNSAIWESCHMGYQGNRGCFRQDCPSQWTSVRLALEPKGHHTLGQAENVPGDPGFLLVRPG